MYDQHKQYEALLLENTQLENKLKQTEDLLALANEKNIELEKNSIDGILRETNETVISGWESLLDTVKKELYKARDIIKQQGQPDSQFEQKAEQKTEQEKNNSAAPNLDATPNTPPAISTTETISGERT